ncbi:hypothetical protein CMK18_24025 [Candidatus Poribacteria bacterium]|nr:hypothetical protein [Candidatus Poribacteria bacterium]
MAEYPNNYGGIVSAIQACIVAAGGTLTTEYPKNVGGVISALLALQTAIAGGGGGGGGSVTVELEAAQNLDIGDAVFVNSDGKVAKAHHASGAGRDGATVVGLVKEGVVSGAQAKVILTGPVDITGWGQSPADLTVGDRYFLNGNGFMSTTVPSGAGEFVVFLGEAITTKIIVLNIDVPVLLK